MTTPHHTNTPDVSVVLPCRNEQNHIEKCLDSMLEQDFPRDRMEILVVDGMSEDATRQLIRDRYAAYPFIKVLDNPAKITPAAFNVGIRAARGRYVLIMGAHSIYATDYISKCVGYLDDSDADNVGGVCKVLPGADTLAAKAIARALCCPFGVGNSYFRIGSADRRYVDTVFGGCYRRDIFSRIGLFDTDLIRGQDTELNTRLIQSGGKILLSPDIVSYYHARESLSKLWKMEWQYGYFKPLVIKKVGKFFTLRQIVPPLFVLALALSFIGGLVHSAVRPFFAAVAGIYLLANLAVSIRIAWVGDRRSAVYLPVVFTIIHVGWGAGFIKGMWDFFVLQKDKKRHLSDVSLSR